MTRMLKSVREKSQLEDKTDFQEIPGLHISSNGTPSDLSDPHNWINAMTMGGYAVGLL